MKPGPRNRPPKRTASTQEAVEAAVTRGVRDGHIDRVLDGPLVGALRVLARGLDEISPAANPYGAARLACELRAATEALRMTPGSRAGEGADWQAEFMRMMADPTVD